MDSDEPTFIGEHRLIAVVNEWVGLCEIGGDPDYRGLVARDDISEDQVFLTEPPCIDSAEDTNMKSLQSLVRSMMDGDATLDSGEPMDAAWFMENCSHEFEQPSPVLQGIRKAMAQLRKEYPGQEETVDKLMMIVFKYSIVIRHEACHNGMFRWMMYANHSCTPNTRMGSLGISRRDNDLAYEKYMAAIQDIPTGAEICWDYADWTGKGRQFMLTLFTKEQLDTLTKFQLGRDCVCKQCSEEE